jgi:hypothetical protein
MYGEVEEDNGWSSNSAEEQAADCLGEESRSVFPGGFGRRSSRTARQ